MDWKPFIGQFLNQLAGALPWLLSVLAAAAVLGWSPLGRALLRYLRGREQESMLLEDLIAHTTAMRQEIADAVERLDATDRLLRGQNTADRPPAASEMQAPLNPLPRQVTPH